MITPKDSSLPWNRIAENIPHRTGIQCQARWTEALDPAVRKGRWHPDEDEQLKVAIEKFGCCWIRVASMIPTRTQRQCRTRWNQIHSQHLKATNLMSKKSLSLDDTKSRKIPHSSVKHEFMPPTFPNEASITIKQEEDLHVQRDACIFISASPKIEEVTLTGSYQFSSPTSIRSSSFSSTSPTPSILSLPNESSSSILMHDKGLVDPFPMAMEKQMDGLFYTGEPMQADSLLYNGSFLNNSDLDFLLNYL
jgi:hypothetical protein